VGCFCFFVFQAWFLDHLRFVSSGCWSAVFKVILSYSLVASIIWLLLCNTIRQPNNITNCISFSRCKYTFYAKLFVFCLLLLKQNMYVLLLINLIANLIKYVYKLLIWLHIYKYVCKYTFPVRIWLRVHVMSFSFVLKATNHNQDSTV